MIHPGKDGTFQISSHDMWLPGIYASEQAARYAFRFGSSDLSQLSERVCSFHREDRAITMDDLRELRSA